MAANDIRLPRMHACLAKAIAAVSSFALASALVGGSVSAPAYAEDIDTDPTPDELQQEIERTAAELEAAEARSAELVEELEANSLRLVELEAQIPEQQKRSDAAARELYKTQQQSFGIVEVILSSENLGDFLSNVEYVNHVTETNLQEIKRLRAMEAELKETQAALQEEQAEAERSKAEAEAALTAAQEARAEAQRKAEEEARRQAEQAAAAAAAAAKAEAERAAAEAAAAAAESGEEPEAIEAPSSEEIAEAALEASDAAAEATSDGADWSADKESFVAEWAARIDAYLAGSPLAGYGSTFASAAWDNGVDPRWSPAISCVESGKGANCFASCNAWGWGSVSWGSWEEAIYDHVQGLARGYGYTVTMEAAAKYCPPNAEHWYNRCLEEMALI